MKNMKIGIMALASCVMLAGCGSDEATIEIKEIPSSVVAGDVIDLADYINVSNGTGGYSVNFSDEDLEKIELVDEESETMVKLLEFGTVSFTVDYSGISKTGTINVGSKLLNDYASEADGAGYSYSSFILDDEGYVASWIEQGPKFYVDNYGASEQGEEAPYGYVEADDGKIYEIFVTSMKPFKYELSYSSYAPESIDEYSFEYTLTSDLLTPIKVEENFFEGEAGEALFSDDPDVIEGVVRTLFGYDINEIRSQYNLDPNGVYVEKVIDKYKGICDGYVVYASCVNTKTKEEGMFDFLFVSFDENDLYSGPSIQSLIDSHFEVEKPDISMCLDLIKDAFEGRNFTAQYDYGWYTESMMTGSMKKLDENPFYDPSDPLSMINFFQPIGSFTYYQTETQTYCENERKEGLVINNGEAYAYHYDEVQSKYVAMDLYQKDFFDVDIPESYAFMSDVDGELFNEIFANYIESNKDGSEITVGWSAISSNELLRTMLYYAIPKNDFDPFAAYAEDFTTLDRLMSLLIENDDWDPSIKIGMIDYFDVEAKMTVENNELTKLEMAFKFYMDQDQSTYTVYEYNIFVTYEFGDASIPGGIDIEYPTK